MTGSARIALVDDDKDLRSSVEQMLRLEGYEVLAFPSAEAALGQIGPDFDGAVVTDVRMPGMGGMAMFRHLLELDPELPVLLMTGHGDIAIAVEALKAGAWDFLTKPFDPDALLAAVARAASKRALTLDNRRLRGMAETASQASPLVGRSPAIVRLREIAGVLAQTDLGLLIEGETGTGKELLARIIHNQGNRRGRFVAVACAGIEDSLIDASLFSVSGPIAAAQGGTLFLDDVDRASPKLQALLTRFAETQTFPDGRGAPPVNCRIIASAGEGKNADSISPPLLYRVAGMRLRIPPLRERPEDVPLLFAHFLGEAAGRLRREIPEIEDAVRDRLLTERWPGNVRQLASFADQVMLGLFNPSGGAVAGPATSLADRVAAFEKAAITDALRQSGGDVARTINALRLPRKTFYYKVNRHGIDLAEIRRALASD